jgi:hypothetical protein
LEENEALNLPRQNSEVAGTSKHALERAIVYDLEISDITLYLGARCLNALVDAQVMKGWKMSAFHGQE